VNRVQKLIKHEVSLLGNADKVFLGGFSQGAALALATYLSLKDHQLGGVVTCSGGHLAIIDWEKVDIQMKKLTPLLFYHGADDPIFPAKFA
jgi:phospholipase/carboxylesterase